MNSIVAIQFCIDDMVSYPQLWARIRVKREPCDPKFRRHQISDKCRPAAASRAKY